MDSNPAITTLEDFVNFYSNFKSDNELAMLLDISVEDIKNVKNSLQKNKTLTYVQGY